MLDTFESLDEKENEAIFRNADLIEFHFLLFENFFFSGFVAPRSALMTQLA